MKMGRILMTSLVCLMLTGCLVTFKEPLPGQDKAPDYLFGNWVRQNEWNEDQYLELTRQDAHHYRAVTYIGTPDNRENVESFDFTVKRQGKRWYLSIAMPENLGGNYAIAGFEITDQDELEIYGIDVQSIQADLGKTLQGTPVEIDDNDGLLISSSSQQVYDYLNDPANSDIFVQMLRFQRAAKTLQAH